MEREDGPEREITVTQKDEEKLIAEKLDYITVNDILQVTESDDPNPTSYYSRVNDISKGKIIIAWPTQRGIRLPVRRGQKLKFAFLRNNIPYAFEGITEETIREPLPQIVIAPAGFVIKTQRRNNFRVKCLVPIEINGMMHLPDSDDVTKRTIAITTVTFDLSVGGVSICYTKVVPEGTLVDVKLTLPDNGPVMKIPCRIAYSEPLPENPAMYHLGIQFLMINEREKSRIFRYIRRLQLKILQV